MTLSEDLLALRNKLQNEILALENTLGTESNIVDLLPSDSDSVAEESDDSGHAAEHNTNEDLEAERQQIQKEIQELERKLGADAALVDDLIDSENGSLLDSNRDDSDCDLELPQDLETCLQMNLVYQEVLNEKLADLERLLGENHAQQKALEKELSGPSYVQTGLPHLRLFLGSFMKPYFKDKVSGLGPPANEETKERLSHGTKPCDEMQIRRWEPWQKTLLINAVATDGMKRMLQPKLSKMEYLTAKMLKAQDADKEGLQNQISLLEKDITEKRSMKEDQLHGDRYDDHDWDKISNIDFEGCRQPDDLMRFWQNYLHPSINKSTWNQDEIDRLVDVVKKYNYCNWEQIAESLGTGRTAFMCFQVHQRCISKQFRKREWNENEDKVFRELVEKMRIGNFIPYTRISYFMEGRDCSQLNYRWTCVLDPSIKKGPWTKEEDQLLLNAVKKYNCKDWFKIRLEVPGRTDNACRDRYMDCLRENIKKGAWSDEEVELLKKMVEKHGVGKWSKIAAEIPNRLDCQCLHKWQWIMQKKDVKTKMPHKRRVKHEHPLKRRKIRRKNVRREKDDESDSSEEEEQVPYMDTDDEQEEENISSDEGSKVDYIQPNRKEWDSACRNNIPTYPGKLKTVLVKLPPGDEDSSNHCVLNTVLDRLGNPLKTVCSQKPLGLDEKSSSHTEDAMIMVSHLEVNRLLIGLRTSAMNERAEQKAKNKLTSCTKKNDAKNVEVEDNHNTKSREKTTRSRSATKLSYDLMLAIAPWIGNVLIPLSFDETRDCEADIICKRAAEIPLLKSDVFLFFLEALKIDTEGCRKVIESRRNGTSWITKPELKLYSAKKSTQGSCHHAQTVADTVVEKKEQKKSLRSPKFELVLPSLPGKIAIPRCPQQRKVKQTVQSASPKVNAAVILPRTVVVTQPKIGNKKGTSHNVAQGVLHLLQLGTQDTSKIPQPEPGLEEPVGSAKVTQSASYSTTSVTITGPSTKTSEEVGTQKRKRTHTKKAQILLDEKNAKRSKTQVALKQQNSSISQAVTVQPQTTAWILTPAGLLPVAIQAQSPIIPGTQNQNAPMLFQPAAIADQDRCVALSNGMRPSPPPTNLPRSNNKPLTVRSNIGQHCTPSSDSGNRIVSPLPFSSKLPTVISMAVPKTPVPQVSPNTYVPTPITGFTAQIPLSKTECNHYKPETSMSPLVTVSSSAVGTSQSLTSSGISVPGVSSVLPVTCPPPVSLAHPLNISGPCTISGPEIQKIAHPYSQLQFQQPVIMKQNGSLPLFNAVGQCIPNAPTGATINVSRVPPKTFPPATNSTTIEISKIDNAVGPSVINNNILSTATTNVTRCSTTVAPPNANMSLPMTSAITSSASPTVSTSMSPSRLNKTSPATAPACFVGIPATVNAVGLPNDQLRVNLAASSMTNSCGGFPPTVVQQVEPQGITFKPQSKQVNFEPSLMFCEEPTQVKNWLSGTGGITLPGLGKKMPYLPPFVSSINTLNTLLRGKDSFLKSAVQLLPEEHSQDIEEEAKIAAIRNMVAERFQTNQAYLHLKARFLSCFTLPTLLTTINPYLKSTDAVDQRDSEENVGPENKD